MKKLWNKLFYTFIHQQFKITSHCSTWERYSFFYGFWLDFLCETLCIAFVYESCFLVRIALTNKQLSIPIK